MNETHNRDGLLAGFVALARQQGVETSVETLRRRYVFADDEAEPPLLAIAVDLGLEARWVRLRASQLPRLQNVLPAMLRLTGGETLILEAVAKSEQSGLVVHVSDPAHEGAVTAVLDEAQLNQVWNGEVLLLKTGLKDEEIDQPFNAMWLVRQVLREGTLIRDISIGSAISTLFAVAPPFLALLILDRVLVNKAGQTLLALAVIVAAMIVAEMVLTFFRRRFMEVLGTRVDGRLNLFVMNRVMRLPMDFFERIPVGEITGKIYRVWYIRGFITGELFETFLDVVMLLVLIPILLLLNWKMTFWVLGLGASVFLIVLTFIGPLNRLYGKVVASERAKGTYLIESLHGIKTVKSLALEGRRRRGWDDRVATAVQSRYDWGMLAATPQTLIIPFERLMYAGSLLIGAAVVLYSKETINPGALVAFAMLAGRTGAPLVRVAKLLENLGEVRNSILEVASVVNQPAEETRGDHGLRLPIHGEVQFDKVSFRYFPDSPLALDDCSFEIRRGTIFGIMGRSGSGKTTITRLLQGLNRKYQGAIKLDGMDLKEIDLHHLRTSVGVVPQENFLFTGTVRENIGMAKPGASFAEIVRAAQLAGAEEFVEKLPRGYETWLEEGATNLSGGQRQRLAIARALLIDPPVLVLDEATSALDAESEAIINANLMRMAEGRTIIIVSHRLSMLVPSDAILVMEAGRAYDIGRHEELLHRCDIYKHLWHQQNRHLEVKPNVRPLLARP
ncbi:MAG TPA: peptidase domain-containing ABC transporter [Caulobacteraceae bacterium]|nr:peptidase domain-containing ABC transporter [Caulobacteraceae bacterium]